MYFRVEICDRELQIYRGNDFNGKWHFRSKYREFIKNHFKGKMILDKIKNHFKNRYHRNNQKYLIRISRYINFKQRTIESRIAVVNLIRVAYRKFHNSSKLL